MLTQLMTLIRRESAIPDKCPSCDCGLPLEAVGHDRFVCHGCSRECSAVRTPDGDWAISTGPRR